MKMATKEIQPSSPIGKPAKPTGLPQENFITRAWGETVRYLKGVQAEAKRVSWPTPKELRYNTIVVLIVVIGISTYMWLVDQALTYLFRLIHRA